jgi:putative peptidoglycan lipid II flippase
MSAPEPIPPVPPVSPAGPVRPARRAAGLVAAGILLSRLSGLVRLRVFAHYFGKGDAADAFYAALKIPNLLQNLFGEGVLSASFIPVYAGLLGRGEEKEANRVAGVIAAVLSLVTAVLVLLGIVATPLLIGLIAPGFSGEKREVTIRLVRILFPGVGLLVLSAWCLGVLNSHRRFFLSYAAPVIWNATMVVAMLAFGRGVVGAGGPGGSEGLYRLAAIVAAAASVGSLLQIAMQLPTVLVLARGLRLSLDTASAQVREVFRSFGPVVVSRGVVQVSAYVDQMIASFLGQGAVAGLTYAQTLYTLPVSLFGMAISASELPEMSRAVGDPAEVAAYLRGRLGSGLRRIAFLVVPSAMAFLALGDVVAGLLLETGRFDHKAAVYVWAILAGSAVGLLASTLGRLYSSTFYALRDTRTPLRYAAVRVVLTTGLGYLCALPLPRALGLDVSWGAAGLTASAGAAGWVEFLLLSRGLGRRIGAVRLPAAFLGRLWAAAAAGAALGWGVKLLLGARGAAHPLLLGLSALGLYGLGYLGATAALGLPEAGELAGGFLRRLRRLRGFRRPSDPSGGRPAT